MDGNLTCLAPRQGVNAIDECLRDLYKNNVEPLYWYFKTLDYLFAKVRLYYKGVGI